MRKRFVSDYATNPNWNTVVLLGEEFATNTSYDALNRPISVTHPDNSVISYGYDKGGLLKQIVQGSTQYITNITYNARGQRENIYYGNNTKTRHYYNPLNFRLHRLLTTRNTGEVALQDLNYRYDSAGNIVLIRDDAQQTLYFSNSVIVPTSTFEYDALYRLTKATGRELTGLTAPANADFVNNKGCPNTASNAMRTYTHNYAYDQLGNISNDGWKSYVYDTATNRLLRHTGTTNVYTYDAHGNMTKMPNIATMNWDCFDRLISAANGTSFTSYYAYDAEGNRTRKVTVKGTVREERYYIGSYEVYRKYTNTTLNTERKSVNVSDDEKVFLRKDGTLLRYQYDNHLGSACLELDHTGAIISYEEYHPFGTTSYRSGRSEAEVSLKRYKYCGKERDEETGLYYYGARYYAAWLGRFINVDPLQFKFNWVTPYNYAENRPISGIDFWGLQWVSVVDKDSIVNITTNINFDIEKELLNQSFSEQELKNTISKTFDDVLNLSSGGEIRGRITFEGGSSKELGKVVPSLSVYGAVAQEDEVQIGGLASNEFTSVNAYNRDGQIRSLHGIATDAVHELLHTIRLEHPFEKTQGLDTELIHEGGLNYSTTANTDSSIFYNIMNYGRISINGQNLKELWQTESSLLLTPDQLNLLLDEVNLQQQGYGIFNYDSNLNSEENAKKGIEYKQNYWFNTPGKDVERKR